VVLGNLIALWQVGIEVVLACELRDWLNGTVEGQRRGDGRIDGGGIQHRERSGQTEADGTGLAVGRRAERRAAATENLGAGRKLGVHLEADDGFEGLGGRRRRWGRRGHGAYCSRRDCPPHAQRFAFEVDGRRSTDWSVAR